MGEVGDPPLVEVVPGTHVVSPGLEAVSSFPPDGMLLRSEAGGDGCAGHSCCVPGDGGCV